MGDGIHESGQRAQADALREAMAQQD